MKPLKMKFVSGTSFLMMLICFTQPYDCLAETCSAERTFLQTCQRHGNDGRLYSKNTLRNTELFERQSLERNSRIVNVRERVGTERLVNNRRIVDSDSRISNFPSRSANDASVRIDTRINRELGNRAFIPSEFARELRVRQSVENRRSNTRRNTQFVDRTPSIDCQLKTYREDREHHVENSLSNSERLMKERTYNSHHREAAEPSLARLRTTDRQTERTRSLLNIEIRTPEEKFVSRQLPSQRFFKSRTSDRNIFEEQLRRNRDSQIRQDVTRKTTVRYFGEENISEQTSNQRRTALGESQRIQGNGEGTVTAKRDNNSRQRTTERVISDHRRTTERDTNNRQRSIDRNIAHHQRTADKNIETRQRIAGRNIDNQRRTSERDIEIRLVATERNINNRQRTIDNRQRTSKSDLDNRQRTAERNIDNRQQSSEGSINNRQRISERRTENRQRTFERNINNRQRSTERSINDRQGNAERDVSNRQRTVERDLDNRQRISERDVNNRQRTTERSVNDRRRNTEQDFNNRQRTVERDLDNRQRTIQRDISNRQRIYERSFENRQLSLKRDINNRQRTAERDLENRQRIAERDIDNRQRTAERDSDNRQRTAERNIDHRQETSERDTNNRQGISERRVENRHNPQRTAQRDLDNRQRIAERVVNNRQRSTESSVNDRRRNTERDVNSRQRIAERDLDNRQRIAERVVNNRQRSTERSVNDRRRNTERDVNSRQRISERDLDNRQRTSERNINNRQRTTERSINDRRNTEVRINNHLLHFRNVADSRKTINRQILDLERETISNYRRELNNRVSPLFDTSRISKPDKRTTQDFNKAHNLLNVQKQRHNIERDQVISEVRREAGIISSNRQRNSRHHPVTDKPARDEIHNGLRLSERHFTRNHYYDMVDKKTSNDLASWSNALTTTLSILLFAHIVGSSLDFKRYQYFKSFFNAAKEKIF